MHSFLILSQILLPVEISQRVHTQQILCRVHFLLVAPPWRLVMCSSLGLLPSRPAHSHCGGILFPLVRYHLCCLLFLIDSLISVESILPQLLQKSAWEVSSLRPMSESVCHPT